MIKARTRVMAMGMEFQEVKSKGDGDWLSEKRKCSRISAGAPWGDQVIDDDMRNGPAGASASSTVNGGLSWNKSHMS